MTVSVLKTHFCKLPPKVVTCGDFKKFENERFMDFLKLTLNSEDVEYNVSIMLQKKESSSVGIINLS